MRSKGSARPDASREYRTRAKSRSGAPLTRVMPPSAVTDAHEHFFMLSKGSFRISSQPDSVPNSAMDDSKACSVAFPPMTSVPDKAAEVLYSADSRYSRNNFADDDRKTVTLRYSSRSVKMPDTLSFPSVSVPVLSVNRIFILPADSMPTGLRTRTLSFTIFLMLEDSTTAIIIGSPSGTATTTTVSPKVKASRKVVKTKRMSDSFIRITSFRMPLSRTIALKRYTSPTRMAAAYPRRLICLASLPRRSLRGLSRVSRRISREISPIKVRSPTTVTSISASPDTTEQPRSRAEMFAGDSFSPRRGSFSISRLSPVMAA